jgi:hypothetical protein
LASCLITAKPAFSSENLEENSWVSKANMRVARSSLSVAGVNGKIYAIGGTNWEKKSGKQTSGGVVGTNEEYNPATDTWTYKKPMPTPMADFTIAVFQNEIYCLSGKVNEVYDTVTDTWETKAPMPTARDGLQANVAGGKIYLIGGYDPNNCSNRSELNEVYDPVSDSWTRATPMPTAGVTVLSAVVNNKIYVMSDLNQIYDVETDTWSLGTPMPYPDVISARSAATTGVNAPKRIYVFGGGVTQVYDPENDSWTMGANVLTDCHYYGIGVTNDMFYVIGGFTQEYLDFPDDWIYGPQVTKYATNDCYTPFGFGTPDPFYDATAPLIEITSPENKTYRTIGAGLNFTDIALDFTVDEPIFSVHFVLDGGTPVEVLGNTTLSGLAIGAHNVTVSAFDAAGNMDTSETVFFAVAEPESFPAAPVAAASIVTIVVVSVALLFYFKKRKH